jgi:preprotein translocase subunit SecE
MSQVTEFPEGEPRPASGVPAAEGTGGLSIRLPKLPLGQRIAKFYHDVKMEMRRTTWPTRSEVWSTTLVVLIAVVFFGFYLSGIDYLIGQGFKYLEKVFK